MNDAAIIGGGPAGSATAIHLAEAGRRVLLLEREAEPHHKVCGEFLSGDTLADLRSFGVEPTALGAAPIERVRLLHRGTVSETALPFPAAGLSRLRLDAVMLERARAAGANIRLGTAARFLESDDGAARVRLSDDGAVDAAAILLATGKHGLRGQQAKGREPSDLIGFKMHLRLEPDQMRALDGHVELLLFRGGYAGLQPVEDGLANLCLLIAKRSYERLGRDWSRVIGRLTEASPLWRDRLTGATFLWPRPLAVYGLPYGYVTPSDGGAVYRLGDQAAMIPSFAGDGLAMALFSGRAAAQALLNGQSAADYHADLARRFRPQVRRAVMVDRLLERPLGQRFAALASRLAPGLVQATARRLRVPGAPLSGSHPA